MKLTTTLVSYPPLWNLVQHILGAPRFKRELYRSVLTPPARLLDFGCATGHIADTFQGFEYYGLDIDTTAIAAARRRFRHLPTMHFVAADIRDHPFPENFFGAALLATTAHHLSDTDLQDILHAIAFCLKPGATLHLIDPVRQDTDGWQQRLQRWMDQGRYPRSLGQILTLLAPLADVYRAGPPSLHRPYGAMIRDCDFLHLPLTKC